MRLIILFFILTLTLTSCGSKYDSAKQDEQFKEIFINEFKTTYFKVLLRKGFNNNRGYNEAVKIDVSGFTEPILSSEDLQYIDSLAVDGNHFMVSDSAKSIGQRAEGAEGKQVFYYALDRYNSKWLDSIAKQRLKKFWKAELNFRKGFGG